MAAVEAKTGYARNYFGYGQGKPSDEESTTDMWFVYVKSAADTASGYFDSTVSAARGAIDGGLSTTGGAIGDAVSQVQSWWNAITGDGDGSDCTTEGGGSACTTDDDL